MHRVGKAAQLWEAAIVENESGPTANPLHVLKATAEEYAELWSEVDRPTFLTECCQQLEPLTPGQIRAASALFPQRTARGPDGLHPSHVGLLCDQGLRTLSIIKH